MSESTKPDAVAAEVSVLHEDTIDAGISRSRIVWNGLWILSILWGLHFAAKEFTALLSGNWPPFLVSLAAVTGAVFALLVKADTAKTVFAACVRQVCLSYASSICLPMLFLGSATLAWTWVGLATIDIEPSPVKYTITLTDGDGNNEIVSVPRGKDAQRLTYWVGCNPRIVTANSPGLPSRQIELKRWRKTSVDREFLFSQPAVLILADHRLWGQVKDGSKVLKISIQPAGSTEETVLDPVPFSGNAMWFGITGDPDVPPWQLDEWQNRIRITVREGDRKALQMSLARWKNPDPWTGRNVQLNRGDTVTFQVYHAGVENDLNDPRSITVTTPTQLEDFPTEVLLDARETQND